jgi:hypothetical protein
MGGHRPPTSFDYPVKGDLETLLPWLGISWETTGSLSLSSRERERISLEFGTQHSNSSKSLCPPP